MYYLLPMETQKEENHLSNNIRLDYKLNSDTIRILSTISRVTALYTYLNRSSCCL